MRSDLPGIAEVAFQLVVAILPYRAGTLRNGLPGTVVCIGAIDVGKASQCEGKGTVISVRCDRAGGANVSRPQGGIQCSDVAAKSDQRLVIIQVRVVVSF